MKTTMYQDIVLDTFFCYVFLLLSLCLFSWYNCVTFLILMKQWYEATICAVTKHWTI